MLCDSSFGEFNIGELYKTHIYVFIEYICMSPGYPFKKFEKFDAVDMFDGTHQTRLGIPITSNFINSECITVVEYRDSKLKELLG